MDAAKPNVSDILNKRFWIFDLDGTLTVAVHDFPAIRRELGVPEGKDILGHITGLESTARIRLLNRLNEIEIVLADNALPAVGTLNLVHLLKTKMVRMGIITRNTRANARRSLEKIGISSCFKDGVILGRDEALPKPDPSGIRHLLDHWEATIDQTVMVGDDIYDLQAGRNAGINTIHVDLHRKRNWQNLADLQVDSLQDIVDLFANTA